MWVLDLQETLNAECGSSIPEDGIFGRTTELQVVVFQDREGLTPDGMVGPKTWEALGYVDFGAPNEIDEILGSEDWRGDMRRLLMRYQMLMWAGSPVLAIVPIWASFRQHPISGAGWIGPGIIAACFIPIWLMFGKLFMAFRQVFAGQEVDEARTRLARIAEQDLAIRKAERLRRARVRLAKITEEAKAEKSHRMALDIDKIRRSLDDDPTNDR